jgi:poly(3-hydroxybutyrate) depolymerase
MPVPPEVSQANLLRASYDVGRTAIYSAKVDLRFQYCLYVPPQIGPGTELVVCVHGTSRTSFLEFRDGFAEFGRWNDCAILCPIFPMGPLGDGARSGYKYMQEGDIRYDRVMLGIVEEVAEKYGRQWNDFAMFGYSGGGHFTHRFAILHPRRLWAACIGASGSVTLLDPDRDWWVGIRNLQDKFGIAFDRAALARVPVQMLVGDADLETWEITHQPGGTYWMEGANDAGRTRPERLRALQKSFEAAGVKVRFELMPGVSHNRLQAIDRVQDFLAGILKQRCS